MLSIPIVPVDRDTIHRATITGHPLTVDLGHVRLVASGPGMDRDGLADLFAALAFKARYEAPAA